MAINILGKEIRKLRKETDQSLFDTASALGVERSHLNKIELGTYKPSAKMLEQIITHFSVKGNKANRLRKLRGEEVERLVVGLEEERGDNMDLEKRPATQVSLNPVSSPVLYSDSIMVSSSDYGLVLDIAQSIGTGKQHVVARVGMSFDHAKKLAEVISDNLEKNER